MRSVYWIPKAKNRHSEYVILIAFPLQQWLHERALLLRYTYIACLVITMCVCVYIYIYKLDVLQASVATCQTE